MGLLARRALLALQLLALSGPPAALAAGTAAEPAAEPAAEHAAAAVPIRVGNRTIVALRGTLLGYSAQERADAAERRVQDLVDRGAQARVSTRLVANAVAVEGGGRTLFLITPDDVNALLDETPALVAEQAARALERAIGEAREERQPRMLLLASAQAALATLVWLLLLRALQLSNRWLGAWWHRPPARTGEPAGEHAGE